MIVEKPHKRKGNRYRSTPPPDPIKAEYHLFAADGIQRTGAGIRQKSDDFQNSPFVDSIHEAVSHD